MSAFTFHDLLTQLEKSGVTTAPIGVSFQGKGLKLDTEQDCGDVIQAIRDNPDMTYLDMEGNTLGVDAAKAIGEALKTSQNLSRALWKDLFTGRMKTEIPLALEYLTGGLQTAGARLTELDLSDNAFGPIGVEALANFLQSPVCFGLLELRLNNNGLGITGGKILAGALLKAYANSCDAGKPLALRVFVAGRNRLENDGSSALAQVFKSLGSLEEISMPQNGIYYKGISKLSDAFTCNPKLRVINLNDNTLTARGAKSLADALPSLQELQDLNLGDCLVKTKGAIILAEALSKNHCELEKLVLDSNEIRPKGGLAVVQAMKNKKNLKTLCLSCNEFGEKGRASLRKEAELLHIDEILECPSDDDAEASEDEDNASGDEETGSESSEDDDGSDDVSEEDIAVTPVKNGFTQPLNNADDSVISDFLEVPSSSNFLKLVEKDFKDVVNTLQSKQNIVPFVQLLMKVSNLKTKEDSKTFAFKLYKALFTWAEEENILTDVNNELFVHLKLIKGEDKQLQVNWDAEKCINILQDAVVDNIVPKFTQDILTCCLKRKTEKLS